MSKFNKKVLNKTVNLAGGIAFKRPLKEELVFGVLSTFLEDKYYESGDERMTRLSMLVSQIEPEFISKLAIIARKEFHLRSVFHLLIGELSKNCKGKSIVKDTIIKGVERPDDLLEILAYVGKPIPNQIKKGIREAIKKFNPYQLAKYQGKTKEYSLVDLFNLVHPSGNRKEWKDLMKGKLKSSDTWEVRLSSGEDKAKVWRDLVGEDKIGYMALLRNLRNIDEQADKKTKQNACKLIADREKVKTSKQLPFRFYNAYEHISNQDMLEAISQAIEYSLDNVPKFKGKTLVAVDASGSMSDDPSVIKKASIFASALVKSNDTDLILYDTDVKEIRYLKSEPILTLAEKIQKEAMGGGTNTSLVFKYAIEKEKNYDRIIILSDNQSWQERGYDDESSTGEVYSKYKKDNDCYIYAIDIQGYGTKDISGEKVFHLCGWSERIFDFMNVIEKKDGIVKYIENYKI